MLKELLNQQNIIVSITPEQLNEFATQILHGARDIYEKKEVLEKYVSRNCAAKQLDKDLSSLHRWAKSGYLVPVSWGGRRMYRQSDIDKIMKGATA